MASGSNAPFSGDHSDLENVKGGQHHDKGMSDQETETQLALINDIAENRFANSLSVESYQELLFDSLIDGSKYDSLTDLNVQTGQNGKILLNKQFGTTAIVDSLPDGGSESLRRGIEIEPKIDCSSIKIKLANNVSPITKLFVVENGTIISEKDVSLGGGDTAVIEADFNKNTKYLIECSNSGSNYTNAINFSPNFPYTSGDIEIVGGANSESPSTNAYNIKEVSPQKGRVSSGTATYTKTFDYTPTGVIIQEDSLLNGQDVEYVVSDSSGNSVTVTQSKIGSEVSGNFQDGSMTVKPQLNGDGSETPEIKEFGVRFLR